MYRTIYICIKHHKAKCKGEVEWTDVYVLGKRLEKDGIIVKDYIKGECDLCGIENPSTPH